MSGSEIRRGRAAGPKVHEDVLPIDVPPAAAPPWPVKNKLWAGISTWTTYRGKHQLCHPCVLVVHERGIQAAPPPAPATQKRKGPNGETLCCGPHAAEWQRMDAEAARARADRVRRVAERSKTRTFR